MTTEEAIMICIDNSRWMTFCDNRYSFKLQLNCVRSYCRAKLKCNPKNAIGILTMGTNNDDDLLEPTSDLDKILGHLKNGFRLGNGELDFLSGMLTSRRILERKYPSNRKRMLFFTGGPTEFNMKASGKSMGEDFKKWGIAVDIVNFCHNERFADYWIPGLEELIDAANENNNNNKSHIKHHKPSIWTLARDILPSIVSGAGSLEEEERRCLEAGNPPNTNDEYEDAALEETVQLKNEYMSLGNKDAAQCFAELENSVKEERKMEREKFDPREILRLVEEEEEEKNTTISKPPGVAEAPGRGGGKCMTPKSNETQVDYEDDNRGFMRRNPGHGCSISATLSPQRSRSYVNVNNTNLFTTPRKQVKSFQVPDDHFPYSQNGVHSIFRSPSTSKFNWSPNSSDDQNGAHDDFDEIFTNAQQLNGTSNSVSSTADIIHLTASPNGLKLPPSQQLAVEANLKSQIPSAVTVVSGIFAVLIVLVCFLWSRELDEGWYNLVVPT